MPEAITKYAINSTLGTDDFQPLDKIFTNSVRLITDENHIFHSFPISDIKTSINNERKEINKIEFNVGIDGAAYLEVLTGTWLMNYYASVEWYLNDQLIRSYDVPSTNYVNPQSQVIQLKKGDTVKIVVYSNPGAGTDTVRTSISAKLKAIPVLAVQNPIVEV